MLEPWENANVTFAQGRVHRPLHLSIIALLNHVMYGISRQRQLQSAETLDAG
jgi:hypothetical protein